MATSTCGTAARHSQEATPPAAQLPRQIFVMISACTRLSSTVSRRRKQRTGRNRSTKCSLVPTATELATGCSPTPARPLCPTPVGTEASPLPLATPSLVAAPSRHTQAHGMTAIAISTELCCARPTVVRPTTPTGPSPQHWSRPRHEQLSDTSTSTSTASCPSSSSPTILPTTPTAPGLMASPFSSHHNSASLETH